METEELENEVENEEELETEQEEVSEETPPEEEAPPEEPKRPLSFQRRLNRIAEEKRKFAEENENLKRQLADALEGKTPIPEDEIDKRARNQASQMLSQQKFNEACNTAHDRGVEEFPNFADSMKTLTDLGAFEAAPGFLPAILELEEPHKMLQRLGQDPEEAAKIMEMSPTKQAIELARMEAAAKAPKPKQVSKAPPPITPVTAGNTKTGIKLEDDDVPIGDWLAERNRQLEDRGKRRW